MSEMKYQVKMTYDREDIAALVRTMEFRRHPEKNVRMARKIGFPVFGLAIIAAGISLPVLSGPTVASIVFAACCALLGVILIRRSDSRGMERRTWKKYPNKGLVLTYTFYNDHFEEEDEVSGKHEFQYKLKFEAMKHQGRTSGQVGPKLTVDDISEDDSGRQVKRYIRLTNLIPELLDLMDEGRIAFSVGVELSYLDQESQEYLADLIDRDDRTPSYSQAVRMHKEFVAGTDGIGLPWYRIAEIMSEDKPNQREQIKLRRDDLNKYFPSSYTDDQIKRDILKGLDLLKRQRSRDAR